jgi:hypothetical protein
MITGHYRYGAQSWLGGSSGPAPALAAAALADIPALA